MIFTWNLIELAHMWMNVVNHKRLTKHGYTIIWRMHDWLPHHCYMVSWDSRISFMWQNRPFLLDNLSYVVQLIVTWLNVWNMLIQGFSFKQSLCSQTSGSMDLGVEVQKRGLQPGRGPCWPAEGCSRPPCCCQVTCLYCLSVLFLIIHSLVSSVTKLSHSCFTVLTLSDSWQTKQIV